MDYRRLSCSRWSSFGLPLVLAGAFLVSTGALTPCSARVTPAASVSPANTPVIGTPSFLPDPTSRAGRLAPVARVDHAAPQAGTAHVIVWVERQSLAAGPVSIESAMADRRRDLLDESAAIAIEDTLRREFGAERLAAAFLPERARLRPGEFDIAGPAPSADRYSGTAHWLHDHGVTRLAMSGDGHLQVSISAADVLVARAAAELVVDRFLAGDGRRHLPLSPRVTLEATSDMPPAAAVDAWTIWAGGLFFAGLAFLGLSIGLGRRAAARERRLATGAVLAPAAA